MSALKKIPSKSRDGYFGNAGAARTPTYTGPLLVVNLFSVVILLSSDLPARDWVAFGFRRYL